MTAKVRTIKIDLAIRDGYDTVLSESINLPSGLTSQQIAGMLARRLDGMIETANDLYPPVPDPIEITLTPS
jgi:hypothetical protein